MFNIKDGILRISVRNMVEFICRRGNIDNSFSGISDKNAMEAGKRAHKKIQKTMGPDYKSEVSLSVRVSKDKFDIQLEGRADGIFVNDGTVYIDEIKGVYRDVRYISDPVFVHKAQAMCYGYMYAVEEGLESIGIRVTYVNLETEDTKYIEEVISFDKLSDWFHSVVDELEKWGNYLIEHRELRDKSIEVLEFPFEYRRGQRELAVNVYKAIEGENNLFIQAPTGVGKTISTVFPTIKAMPSGNCDKIFYLTAKNVTGTVAEETFSILRERGLNISTVTITAKEKICLAGEECIGKCNPEFCPYAKGHFDRINDAVYDIITHEQDISRQIIKEYAIKHMVCPFEFALDISYMTDGVICDYNYVFDPHVRLKRFFAEGIKGNYVFLVDEAHNLVNRAREMYSASVYKDDFLAIKKLVAPHSKKLSGILDKCNKNLLSYKRECDGEYKIYESEDTFALNMMRLADEIAFFMEKNQGFDHMEELVQFYFDVLHYNDIHERLSDNYTIYGEHMDKGFMLRLFCINPSDNLNECIGKGRMGVFFSATLLPVNYYKELLTGNSEDYAIYAESSFDVSKRRIIIGTDVTSRYTRRNDAEYRKVKQYITDIISCEKGNYMVFFPSYRYMESVYELFTEEERQGILIQEGNMSEEDRVEFLNRFGDDTGVTGFCVMGGVFSEGIDLKGEKLIGAIIVGTGLPSISVNEQVLKEYYDGRYGKGFEYAYIYPGMNKVMQAAGRVIRTENDRGIIVLLDERFLQSSYRSLFPREWNNYKTVDMTNVREEILDFWNNMIYNITESVFR